LYYGADMYIPSKRKILVDFFENDKVAANRWLNRPIKRISGKTAKDVLYTEPYDLHAIDILFENLEYGIFAQIPPNNAL